MLASHGIEYFLKAGKQKWSFRLFLIMLVDITGLCIHAIVKSGIFYKEFSVLKLENCFCLPFTVCNFILNIQLNFVCQSVLYYGDSRTAISFT